MKQAPGFDSLSFDPFSLLQDGLTAPEVDVGRGEVLQALVIALDLALGLRVVRGAADVIHLPIFQPFGQFARDVTRPIVTEQSRFVQHRRLVTA